MAQGIYNFPAGFLWGTATAAHQVEGGNTNNNWYAWEQQPGRIIHGDKSGLACDWWGGRWKEDFDRAAESGQNAHRLSVEWSRIQPAADRWNEDALDYYRQMLRGLLERGMTPMVTLHHFTDPLWLAERGGWENEETPGLFARFCEKVVEALQEYVSLWVTINEPNVYAYAAYVFGEFPPGKKNLQTGFRVMANLVRGHALAYRAIHRLQAHARVGLTVNYRSLVPARPGFPLDRWAAGVQSALLNNFFPRAARDGVLDYVYKKVRLPEAAGTQDFLGIQYYTRDLVKFDLTAASQVFGRRSFPPGAQVSPTGFLANVPEGLFEALKWGLQFKIPLIVTENGVEDDTDSLRPSYIVEHIHQLWRAVNFSWPIKGYFHWSLVDNFEWERGWTQRFGLWELDIETQARRRRLSVDLYEAICRENALSSDTVTRYTPELMESLFPG